MSSDSRERVFCALEHKAPDRCPVDFWVESATENTLKAHYGVKSFGELLDLFNVDMQFVFPPMKSEFAGVVWHSDGSWTDASGKRMKRIKNAFSEYTETLYYPLQDMNGIDEVRRYDKWPCADAYDWAAFSDAIGKQNEKRVIKLHTGGLFESAWSYRGQERYLMDMALEPEIPRYIMGKLCDFWCEFVSRAMDAAGDKIDIVYTYDDIATQRGLIMSPKMLEEFVYPYHRRLNALIHGFGKRILYHSCGAVKSQIENLKNLPIDILNPLQPAAEGMDFEEIKSEWGDALCFHGGIDIQSTLPKGTPEEVREAVRRAIRILGRQGGYIMTSAHYIQNDTPVSNIEAMYDVSIR